MRLAWLLAIVLAAGPALADELPYVPSPAGFVESSKLIPALAAQAMIGQPPFYKVIGVYLLPTEATAMLQNTMTNYLSTYLRAYLIHDPQPRTTPRHTRRGPSRA